MRIAHIAASFYPNKGGIETHIFELANEQAKKSEVTVFTVGKRRRDWRLGRMLVREYPGFMLVPGTAVRFSPSLALALFSEKFDILHSHGYFSPFPLFAAAAARLRGGNAVFTLHGYPEPASPVLRMLRGFYDFAAAGIFLPMTGKIITVSPQIPEILRRHRKKTVFVPNGVSGMFGSVKNAGAGGELAYVGRISPDKRIDWIFSAMTDAAAGRRLAIVGKDYGDFGRVSAEAARLEVRITRKEVRYESMPSVYGAASAVVLPSAYEGFPMVWLESVASGTPVFTAKTGAWREFFPRVFGRHAPLFLFESRKELGERLAYFLRHRKKFAGIMASARKKALENYGWKRIARMTMDAYA